MAKYVRRETLRKCGKCGKEHARKHSYCHACHAENMKKYRAERVTLTKGEYERILRLASPTGEV